MLMKQVLAKGSKIQVRVLNDLYPVMQQILMRQNKMRRSIEYQWGVSSNTITKIGRVIQLNEKPYDTIC
jgi:uncharacterized protein YerC